jgi:hypothetical protein
MAKNTEISLLDDGKTREQMLDFVRGLHPLPAYIDRTIHSHISTEMRTAFPQSGWYEVVRVHADPGNVSYDIKTSEGVLLRGPL